MSDSAIQRDPILTLLLQRRNEMGLRQQEVADRAGISRRSLVSIEGGNDCTLSTLRSLCDVLDIDLQAAKATRARKPRPFSARSLRSTAQVSDQQADRELAEALRVQSMPNGDLSSWLEANWGRLQEQADILYADVRRPAARKARHFKTLEDKNRFDEERETAFAVAVTLAGR